MKTRSIYGQDSFRLANKDTELYVTEKGGHMGPVTFDRKTLKIQPFSVAPWAKEKLSSDTPPIIEALRGDFFCMPFGGNDTLYRGEKHPIHGETANNKWAFESLENSTLHLSLKPKQRKGRVDKFISLKEGHAALYVKHRISGMSGKVNLGHHAMLKFPDEPGSGLISSSKFVYGQTCPVLAEDPAIGGYSSLEPNTVFKNLNKVKMQNGDYADLSSFPARKGFEDIVMTVADPKLKMAWTAVVFPKEGYLWYSLKDPQVLKQTVFWISNGGRHYEPWNGRHFNVIGLEDVTSYFHFGLAESVKKNPISEKGYPTTLQLNAKKVLDVNYIMGVAGIPKGFGRVKKMLPQTEGLHIVDEKGKKCSVAVDLSFLK